ncbi:PepSY domain-containing protein [Streptosporangium carneum]|nr:PepSY domain-containing protein [Streptosporangium carneum]
MNDGKHAKAIIGTVFAGSALLAAAACGNAPTQSGSRKAAPAGVVVGLVSPSGTPGDPGQDSGGMASLEKACAAAVNAVKGSTVLSVQAENDGRIWGVQLAGPEGAEQLLEVDASGKVVSGPRTKVTGEEEKARVTGIVKDSRLSYEEAAKKVSSSVPHGRITHMSLDRYTDNLLVWDVDVVTPDGVWHEVKVDAKDGAVTKDGHRD